MWQNWVAAVLGLWTIVVPFLGLTGDALTWTLIVTGALVAGASFWAASEESAQYTNRLERRTR